MVVVFFHWTLNAWPSRLPSAVAENQPLRGERTEQNRMTITRSFDEYNSRLREFIDTFQRGEAAFNELALALFALQFAHVEPYRRVCLSRQATPDKVSCWTEIPPMPTAAFKEFELTSLPAEERVTVFHSSGTTRQRPSRHYHSVESLAIYEASLLPWFRAHLLPNPTPRRGDQDGQPFTCPPATLPMNRPPHPFPLPLGGGEGARRVGEGAGSWLGCAILKSWWLPLKPITPSLSPSEGERVPEGRVRGVVRGSDVRSAFIILTPSPDLVPHSSLAHMLETARRSFGSQDSLFAGRTDADGGWTVDYDAAFDALRKATETRRPAVVLGTAFSFVQLLDCLAQNNLAFQLPAGSRAMETGGYKGRSRSLPRAELHALITRRLGIPSSQIVCEYGMSELSSQAYDWKARDEERGTRNAARVFRFPPWARARVVSPETGGEVAEGETGLIRAYDLANVRSLMAVQTEDLGVRRGAAFELIGRAAQVEPRGCSLTAG